jgi:TrmH family RNA methyltransferase
MSAAAEIVTSRSNARVKQLRAAFAGQARLASGLIAIEGEHLLEEALRSGHAIKTVFLSERKALPTFVPALIEVVRLAGDVFDSCMETQSPAGIAALLVPPVGSVETMLEAPAPLIVIAAGLQDPGNLGTLLRSAEAFAATGLLTTPGTVGIWNQKALRASAGSVFRLPVAAATPEAMQRLEQQGVRLLAAVKDGDDATPVDAIDLTRGCAFLIGNEGAGLDPGWLALADQRVTIPCPGWVESLNAAVAGSLLLYEASRQRRAGRLDVRKR